MSKKKPPICRISLCPGIKLIVCLSEKHVREVNKEYDTDLDISDDPYGAAWMIENDKTHESIGIIYAKRDDLTSRERMYAILVHESVHIAQKYFEWIGEDHPGREAQAYTVQEIAQAAMEMYNGEVE